VGGEGGGKNSPPFLQGGPGVAPPPPQMSAIHPLSSKLQHAA